MTAETNAAALRVQAYLDRLEKARNIGKDVIHGFDMGEPSEAVLYVADIAVLLRANAAVVPSDTVQLADTRRGWVYLAGPMTGYKDWNFPAFHEAAAKLRSEGLSVVNPADHGLVGGAEWADYLRFDIAKIAGCESIALLPGWSQSKGARLEVHVAQALGMGIRLLEGAEQLSIGAMVPQQPVQGGGDAAASIMEKVKRLVRLGDDIGQARSSTVYGAKERAVQKCVELQTQLAAEVIAALAIPPAQPITNGRFVEIGDSCTNKDGSVSTLVDNGDGSIGTMTTGCPDPGPLFLDTATGVISNRSPAQPAPQAQGVETFKSHSVKAYEMAKALADHLAVTPPSPVAQSEALPVQKKS